LLSASPEGLRPPEIRGRLPEPISQPTLSRRLQELRDRGPITAEGKARATRYHAARPGLAADLLADWDAELEHFTRVMPDAYAEVIADRERDDVRTELPGPAGPQAGTAAGVEIGATDD
jgi:hypothetical protein